MSLEDEFAFQLTASGIEFERQYKAIPDRRFKFDFYIKPVLLCEIQGGVFQYQPSHASAGGIRRDAEKSNLAQINGFIVLHFTSDMVKSGEALRMVEEVLK